MRKFKHFKLINSNESKIKRIQYSYFQLKNMPTSYFFSFLSHFLERENSKTYGPGRKSVLVYSFSAARVRK